MSKVLSSDFSGTFDPSERMILTDAFAHAWVNIRATGTYTDGAGDDDRNILAQYILRQAMAGERNQNLLSEGAVAHLAKQRKG